MNVERKVGGLESVINSREVMRESSDFMNGSGGNHHPILGFWGT